MDENAKLSASTLSYLSTHLLDFKQYGKKQMLDSLQICSAEKSEMESMLDLYTQQISDLLDTAVPCEDAPHALPFVIIGSEVELENASQERKLRIHITDNQNKSSTRSQTTLASCLSPMGRALFLKKPGDFIEVHAPAGLQRYVIHSVTLPFS
jgi:transcription elongation factor GreA